MVALKLPEKSHGTLYSVSGFSAKQRHERKVTIFQVQDPCGKALVQITNKQWPDVEDRKRIIRFLLIQATQIDPNQCKAKLYQYRDAFLQAVKDGTFEDVKARSDW